MNVVSLNNQKQSLVDCSIEAAKIMQPAMLAALVSLGDKVLHLDAQAENTNENNQENLAA